jgi:hypothetical protein
LQSVIGKKLLIVWGCLQAHRSRLVIEYVEAQRRRIAHGYFDIKLDVVWDTVQTALPDLLLQLSAIGDQKSGEAH